MAERRTKEEIRQGEIRKALESGGRILPNNFDAEQAVLGCALIDNEASLTVVSKLEEIDFYNESQRLVRALQRISVIDSALVPDDSLMREFIGVKEN